MVGRIQQTPGACWVDRNSFARARAGGRWRRLSASTGRGFLPPPGQRKNREGRRQDRVRTGGARSSGRATTGGSAGLAVPHGDQGVAPVSGHPRSSGRGGCASSGGENEQQCGSGVQKSLHDGPPGLGEEQRPKRSNDRPVLAG